MHSMRAKHAVARSVTLKEAKGKTRLFTKGSVNQIDLPSFPFRLGAPEARPTERGKRGWVGRPFTQGVGLGGLTLGYYQAAPPGLRNGERGAAFNAGRRPFCLPNAIGPAWARSLGPARRDAEPRRDG